MPSKNNLALPARMDIANDSLSAMKIAVLMFPFAKEVKDFCQDIKKVLRNEKLINAPYRQLNNGLLACTSTLTYGFEYFETVNDISQYRALAVGKLEKKLDVPTPEQIHELIFTWAQTWTKQYLEKKGNQDEIKTVCDRFLNTIAEISPNWNWEYLQPENLINDISQNSLGYQAIPSLLVTLLHEKTCVVSSRDREQKIKWRKVQGGGSKKIGLHLVSQPFRANYIDDKNHEREGCFAYRLDFYL